MAYKTIIWEQDRKGVLTITLNRPERLNALTVEMSDELWDAFERAKKSREVRAMVVTGAGRGFCSGADVKDRLLTAAQDQKEKGEPIEPQFNVNGPLLMRSVLKPIIAALNGPAVGFGLTFALACDIRLASEKATLGSVFVRMGLVPEFGGTYNLARLVGVAQASELIFSGRIIDAHEALRMGLVNRVVPAEKLMEATYELATTIAEGPALAMALAKRALYQSQSVDLATQIPFERFCTKVCRDSQDHMEGVRAFMEKQRPRFQDPLPSWLY